MTDLDDFEEWAEEHGVPMPHREVDRKRGILTQKDREYLLGDLEVEGQDERNLRYRMRQRVKESLLDLMLIQTEMHHDDKQKIAETILGDTPGSEDKNHLPGYQLLVFSYWWAQYSPRINHPNDFVENAIENAINGWELTHSGSIATEIDAEITINRADVDYERALERIKNNEATLRELFNFFRNADKEYIQELINRAEEGDPVVYQSNQDTVANLVLDLDEIERLTERRNLDL